MSNAAPPQNPYAQPGPFAPPPAPRKKHTVRNIVLVVLAVFALGVAGCAALIGTAANEVDKAVKASEAKDAEPGGPDNPLAITEGQAFEVSGFNYDPGWKVTEDALGMIEIRKLKVTNNRESKDGALVEIKFMKVSEALAVTDCTTEQIPVGQKTTVDCVSADEFPTGYDKITINDTF